MELGVQILTRHSLLKGFSVGAKQGLFSRAEEGIFGYSQFWLILENGQELWLEIFTRDSVHDELPLSVK